MNKELRAAYEELVKGGDTKLHYVRGEDILAGEEGEGKLTNPTVTNPTVGGTHPSDLGQYDMA